MHTYTSRRPADRTILTGAVVAAVVVAGAAVGLSRVDFSERSDRQPVPASDDPAGSVAVRLPALADGPVPGMPAETYARLSMQARQALLDALPAPSSTLDEVRNAPQR